MGFAPTWLRQVSHPPSPLHMTTDPLWSKQEAQLMLTNPRDAFRSQSKVNKHSTIPYVTYTFLLCNSNFVFKIFFSDIHSTSQNVVTLKYGSEVTQGH